MPLDIWGAIRRAFTLSKSKNSLSDLVGAEREALLKSLAKPLVEDILDEVVGAAGAGLYPAAYLANKAAALLIGAIEDKFGKPISDALAEEIHNAVGGAILGIPRELQKMRDAVERGLYAALKL